MSLPADYHMHTPLCQHAAGEPVEYARVALERGLTEIGFSDHSPMARDGFDNWRMNLSQLGEYVRKVEEARRQTPGLTIKLALEVDYIPGQENWIKELAAMHSWDYLIGSVHYIGDWALDNPETRGEWQRRGFYAIWKDYFGLAAKAARSGLFDIIGHADLCKKFGFYPQEDCTSLYEEFIAGARESGVAIELNTSGLRKDCKEIYPSAQLLKKACAAGVPITFGSDSHEPDDVGAGFAEAVEHARAAGYTQCLRFTGRKREYVPIAH